MTPEGYEKKLVREHLAGLNCYQFWPVQTGYGSATIDCLACIEGVFWGIEVKAKNGKFTQRQAMTINSMLRAGASVAHGDAATIIAILEHRVSALRQPSGGPARA